MEEEISLRELIETILRGKRLIIGITLVVMLTAGVYNYYFLDPVYQAKTVLSVNQVSQLRLGG